MVRARLGLANPNPYPNLQRLGNDAWFLDWDRAAVAASFARRPDLVDDPDDANDGGVFCMNGLREDHFIHLDSLDFFVAVLTPTLTLTLTLTLTSTLTLTLNPTLTLTLTLTLALTLGALGRGRAGRSARHPRRVGLLDFQLDGAGELRATNPSPNPSPNRTPTLTLTLTLTLTPTPTPAPTLTVTPTVTLTRRPQSESLRTSLLALQTRHARLTCATICVG